MSFRPRSRVAGNVLTSSSRSPLQASSSPRLLGQVMGSYKKNQLWNPSVGLRFALKAESRPLYPRLDLSRFLHIPGTGSLDLESPDPRREGPEPTRTDIPNSANGPDNQIPNVVPPHSTEPELQARPEAGEEHVKKKADVAKPPWSSLEYNISHELFHAAKACRADSPGSFWTHTMYRGTGEDGTEQRVKVHYCKSRHTMEEVCKRHFLGEEVIGFDLEWVIRGAAGDPRQNVSLIQMATASRIALFHVALFPKGDEELTGPVFRKIMEDSSVSKVGVNIQPDCTRVTKHLGVPVRGIFELSHLYRLVTYSRERQFKQINRKLVSLATQVENVLHLPLYKGDSVRSSNWHRPLNEKQLRYAAADAYAGFQLFYVLEEQRKQLTPCPPRPYHAELGEPIRVAEPIADEISDDSLDDPDIEDVLEEAMAKLEPQVTSPKPTRSKPKVQKRPEPKVDARDGRIIAAEQKMITYRSGKRNVSAGPSALRAYYMWYDHDDLDPEAIAKLLRDPPLKTNTVVTYILDSVATEKLPYSKARMSKVLALLHPDVASGQRYQTLFEDCRNLAQDASGQSA